MYLTASLLMFKNIFKDIKKPDQEGNKKYFTSIVANNLIMLDSGQKEENLQNKFEPVSNLEQTDNNSDEPFDLF